MAVTHKYSDECRCDSCHHVFAKELEAALDRETERRNDPPPKDPNYHLGAIEKGTTLIELLVAGMIVLIVATVMIPTVRTHMQHKREPAGCVLF